MQLASMSTGEIISCIISMAVIFGSVFIIRRPPPYSCPTRIKRILRTAMWWGAVSIWCICLFLAMVAQLPVPR